MFNCILSSKEIWTESTLDLSLALNKSATLFLRGVCLNEEATEMSAVFGDKEVLTFSDPWSKCQLCSELGCSLIMMNACLEGEIKRISVYDLKSLVAIIPDGYSDVIVTSYIAEYVLLLVYPLGLL